MTTPPREEPSSEALIASAINLAEIFEEKIRRRTWGPDETAKLLRLLAQRLEEARGAMEQVRYHHWQGHHTSVGYCGICHPLEMELSK